MEHLKASTEGFVTLRFQSSDGSSGEAVLDCEDPEKTFHELRRQAVMTGGKTGPQNQMVLNLDAVREQPRLARQFG